MSSRTQPASKTQTGQSTQRRTVIPARSAAPSLRERVGGEAPSSTPRRLVSANTVGGATRVAQLMPGQYIEHERFGVGEVIKVEGTGENAKALIRFENAGEKQLLLKFARFRVMR